MSDENNSAFRRSFIDDHPANYDQQVETARELLLKSDTWILIANTHEGEGNRIHGMLAVTPGADLRGFLGEAVKVYSAIMADVFEDMETDDDGEQESP